MRRVTATICLLAALAGGQDIKSPDARSASATYRRAVETAAAEYEKLIAQAKANLEAANNKAKNEYVTTLKNVKAGLKLDPDAMAKEVIAINAEIDRVNADFPTSGKKLLFKNQVIPANVMWTEVGNVTAGRISITAKGEWKWGPGPQYPIVGPDGIVTSRNPEGNGKLRLKVIAKGSTYIADVGASATINVPHDGTLYLGCKEREGEDPLVFRDNSGSVTVNICR